MKRSKQALEDLQSLEDLLYNDLQAGFLVKRPRRLWCQGALGCDRTPIYGTKYRQPTHCTEHRDETTMVNVVSRMCQHPSLCFTQASFGYERGKPLTCKTHKLGDMKNVISRRCEHDFCLMIPSFGYERGNALRCGTHRLPGMWNVSASTCQYPECKTFATYGYSNKKSIRCATHRLSDMMPTKLLKSIEDLHASYKRQVPIPIPTILVPTTAPPTPRQGFCQVCGIRAFYGNCEIRRAFCKQHMNVKKHWRISFCDYGDCNNVATHTATPDTSKLFLCDMHANPFSQRFAPVEGEKKCDEQFDNLDVNPLEQQLQEALQ
jgi:hypothetical protein